MIAVDAGSASGSLILFEILQSNKDSDPVQLTHITVIVFSLLSSPRSFCGPQNLPTLQPPNLVAAQLHRPIFLYVSRLDRAAHLIYHARLLPAANGLLLACAPARDPCRRTCASADISRR